MATSVAEEHVVTDVIVGQRILHMADPRGQRGYVIFKATSKGMQSRATVRSATARFTNKKFRVVRMRGVRAMTKQTSVFPMTLITKIAVNMVYCNTFNHFGWEPGISSLTLSFIVELLGIIEGITVQMVFSMMLLLGYESPSFSFSGLPNCAKEQRKMDVEIYYKLRLQTSSVKDLFKREVVDMVAKFIF